MKLGQRISSAWNALTGKAIPNIYNVTPWARVQGLNQEGNRTEMLSRYMTWVYACVNIRARAVANAEFQVGVRKGKEFVEIENHPLIELMTYVNPFNTRHELLFNTVAHLDLTGNAYWYVVPSRLGIPGELWVLPPDKMTIVPDKQAFLKGYVLDYGTEKIPFTPEEIVHFSYPNPSDPYYGQSVLMAAANPADIDKFAHEYQRNFYENSAIPAFALEVPGTLSAGAFTRLKEQWDERYRGAANAGRTAILEGGVKPTPIGVKPSELNWLETMRLTRDEILSVFGVPASLLGLVEDVNRANADANLYMFSQHTVEPILTLIDERLTQDLARKYDQRLIVSHESTVPGDEVAEAQVMKIRLDTGLTTRNEERLALGMDEIDGADELLVPSNLTTLEKVKAATPAPVAPPDPNEDTNQQEKPNETL